MAERPVINSGYAGHVPSLDAAFAGRHSAEARLENLKNNPEEAMEVFENYRNQRDSEDGFGDMVKTYNETTLGMAAAAGLAMRGEMPLSEIMEGMSFQEKGMLYQAITSDSNSVGDEAARNYVQSGNNERAEERAALANTITDEFQRNASTNNLTAGQTAVFMAAAGVGDKDEAYEMLRSEYAQKDEQGNIIRGDDGNVVLSDRAEDWVETLSGQLQAATLVGSSHSGSFLSSVNHYNMATGRTDQQRGQ